MLPMALSLEERKKASREMGKKLKVRGQFFGESSSGARGHQGQQQAPSSRTALFGPTPISVSGSWPFVGGVSHLSI